MLPLKLILLGLLCHILFYDTDVLTSNKLMQEDLLLPRTEVREHAVMAQGSS